MPFVSSPHAWLGNRIDFDVFSPRDRLSLPPAAELAATRCILDYGWVLSRLLYVGTWHLECGLVVLNDGVENVDLFAGRFVASGHSSREAIG